jgi:hypothetical protein
MPRPLARRFYRVCFDAAVGWPYPERRVEQVRHYTEAETAGRQIAAIRRLPSHLKLKSVHVSNDIEWTAIDPNTLPIPSDEEQDDDAATP